MHQRLSLEIDGVIDAHVGNKGRIVEIAEDVLRGLMDRFDVSKPCIADVKSHRDDHSGFEKSVVPRTNEPPESEVLGDVESSLIFSGQPSEWYSFMFGLSSSTEFGLSLDATYDPCAELLNDQLS
jgi:hypothetical protein